MTAFDSAPNFLHMIRIVHIHGRGSAVKKMMIYFALVAVSFAVIFSAFVVPPVIAGRIAYARSRAYWAERRRLDDERNLYLMAQLPEYFAGSYYLTEWRDSPLLVILVAEGGYLAARGLWHSGEVRLRRVEFTYAQLLETKAAVITAMEARVGCVYVGSISGPGPGISIACNRITMSTINLGQVEHQNVVAGFRQYVYDSEMIEFHQDFRLPIFVEPRYGATVFMSLLVAAVVAGVMLFWIEAYMARKKGGLVKHL